jgi:hypothetical protein
MTRVCMQQNARRDVFSERCNAASLQWRRGVSTGTWRSMRIRPSPSTSLTDVDRSGLTLHLKDGIFPFGVIFYSTVTWRHHIDPIVTKALRTLIRTYPLLKSERLSAKSKLTLYKPLMRSKMTYACPAWEFAADSHLLKWQRLQSRVLRTTGNVQKRTPTRALHLAFQTPYVYDYITKTCRQRAEVIQNHDNVNVRNTGKNDA